MPKIPDGPLFESKGKERLAINLFDLDRLDPLTRKMLSTKLALGEIIKIFKDRVEEEIAVGFSCNLLEAACICDILRNHDRQAGDWPIRLYLTRGTSWERVPSEVVLTTLVDGKCGLSPRVFKVSVIKDAPLPPERVTFGAKNPKG